ncbi:MAG: VPLPA-CTERM sorting domain-containing protein [Proteobacteria bacterium]|nr:VPLPA-CTERM sorting domain-containing protein [Pseudomonadota bacterium]MBS0573059.1 VPLPA-CTERM sorting domain-containing protein [Pseudomonadota bacterium]
MVGKFSFAGAAFAAAMAVGASGNAAVIDFTSASTGHSGTVYGGAVTWTMSANGYLNNSQKYDGSYVSPAAASTGLSFQTDGYGVGKNDDEITTNARKQEYIEVSFSKPVLVNAIYYLDLFVAKNGAQEEMGNASFSGGQSVNIIATDVFGKGAPGFAAATFKPIWTTMIRFTALDTNDLVGFADGALAGVGLAPVPVPAAGGMLLAGLGGLAALRRRRKA